MNRALWLLLALQLRGRLRRLARAVATVRGAFLALFGAGLLVLFLWPSFSGEPASAEHLAALRRIGPLALAGFCLMNLLLASGERAITFTPAEVNLLFPGPISRRGLLVYKICTGLGGILLAAVFMTVVTRIHQALFVAAFVGLVLTLLFVQLFTLMVALITCALGEHAYTQRRKAVLLLVLALAAIGLLQVGIERLRGNPLSILEEMADAPVVQALLTPFRWLVETVLAEHLWPDLVQWGALSLGLIGLLLLIVLVLDAHYLETAASVSERAYARLERLRQGEMAAAAPSGKPHLGLRSLPFWGGVGPLVWRQLMTALRSWRSLAVMVLAFVMVVLPYALQGPREGEHNLVGPLMGTLVGMSFFVSGMIPLRRPHLFLNANALQQEPGQASRRAGP